MSSSKTDQLRKEIKRSLIEAGLTKVSPEILGQCAAISTVYRLDPKQFATCWEALSLNRNLTELNDRTLPAFKLELLKEADQSSVVNKETPTTSSVVVSRPELLLSNTKRALQEDDDNGSESGRAKNFVTPPAKRAAGGMTAHHSDPISRRRHSADGGGSQQGTTTISCYSRVSLSPGPLPATTRGGGKNRESRGGDSNAIGGSAAGGDSVTAVSDPYRDRAAPGKVTLTYNPKKLEPVDDAEWIERRKSRSSSSGASPVGGVDIACAVNYKRFSSTNVMQPYRHMFTTLPERANALDDHLVRLGECMQAKYNIQYAGSHSNSGGAAATTESVSSEGKGGDAKDESTTEESGAQIGRGESASWTSSSGDVAPLEAVGVPRQQPITCIGRICNAAHEGRINETSVLLEGSRGTSGGQRVEVDLSYLKANKIGFSLFPGQIVAIEGMNSTGRKLTAHRICEGVPPDPARSTVSDLWRFHHSDTHQGSRPLRILTACGPFTTSDNLDYQPLLDLMAIVQHQIVPDVVVLVGPFVDLKHEILASGHAPLAFEGNGEEEERSSNKGEGGLGGGEEFGATYELFFANKIGMLLEEMYTAEPDLPTQFVLVPSLDDAVAEWVYPQPPLSDRVPMGTVCTIPGGEGLELGTLGLHHVEKAGAGGSARLRRETTSSGGDNDVTAAASSSFRRVHCVPNPCTFSVNEVVIGVTSTDSALHLSTSETSANLEVGSRLNRICQHLVQQQSYYPLFPAMLHKANLDLKRMQGWSMPCQPDLLLLPSNLTPFAHRVLDHTLAVNPGRLTQGRTGGTYALAEIYPLSREELEQKGDQNATIPHDIPGRARIEVRRI